MNASFKISLLAILLAVMSSSSLGMISFGYVSKAKAKELGMEIRYKAAGPHAVWVELEFKTEGKLKGFSERKIYNRVELRISDGEKGAKVTAALRENRSQPGRLIVSFSADRDQIDKMSLWVIQHLAGHADVLRMRDFIDLKDLDIPARPTGAEDAADPPGSGAPPASTR